MSDYILINGIPEHRIVMERHISRKLRSEEVVHHINEDKKDNRIENLQLFPNKGAHTAHHWKLRRGEKKKMIRKQIIIDPNLFNLLRGTLTLRGNTVGQWFEEKAREEVYPLHE